MFVKLLGIALISSFSITNFDFKEVDYIGSSFNYGYTLYNNLQDSKKTISDEDIFNSFLEYQEIHKDSISVQACFQGYIDNLYGQGNTYTFDDGEVLTKDEAVVWLMGRFDKYILEYEYIE